MNLNFVLAIFIDIICLEERARVSADEKRWDTKNK